MSEAKKNETLSLTDLSARIVAEAENEKPDAAKLLGWVQDVAALVGAGRSEAEQQLRDQTFLVVEQKFVDLHDVPSLMRLLGIKSAPPSSPPPPRTASSSRRSRAPTSASAARSSRSTASPSSSRSSPAPRSSTAAGATAP